MTGSVPEDFIFVKFAAWERSSHPAKWSFCGRLKKVFKDLRVVSTGKRVTFRRLKINQITGWHRTCCARMNRELNFN